ncbi:MAG: hypothetical protein WC884_00390 [Candidatus Paceibacterota bacterium]
MKTNNLIRFVQALVFLPVMTSPLSFLGIHNIEISQNILVKKVNIQANGILALNQAILPEAELLKAQVEKARLIDAYFKEHDMPLFGIGMKMVQEAEKNDLDWRLLPAIAVRESTGGKFECKKVANNAFGWGSCKIGFKSNEQAIETVARNLGGNNPNTDHHYAGKTTKEILQKYNPPSIVKYYADQVIKIMDAIGDEDVVSIKNT